MTRAKHPNRTQNRPDEMPAPAHTVTAIPTRPNQAASSAHSGPPERPHDQPTADHPGRSAPENEEPTIPLTDAAALLAARPDPTDHGGEPLILTIDQAAVRMNMSVRYVRRLVAERRIPFHKLGRAVRIAVTDVDAHIAGGRVEPLTHSDVWRSIRSVA